MKSEEHVKAHNQEALLEVVFGSLDVTTKRDPMDEWEQKTGSNEIEILHVSRLLGWYSKQMNNYSRPCATSCNSNKLACTSGTFYYFIMSPESEFTDSTLQVDE